jgi:hypothetical protein
MPASEPTGAERDAGYYRADYGRYQPDWIPAPDDVSPSAWDRYLTSQPGSKEHKAAYADMHREANGRGFPGPDPEQSYLRDHGYRTGPDRLRTPEADEDGAEPDDAYPAGRADRVSEAAGRLARAREGTLRERAAFRELRPEPAENLSPLEHAEIDEAVARTAYYAALDGLEAGS